MVAGVAGAIDNLGSMVGSASIPLSLSLSGLDHVRLQLDPLGVWF